MHPNFYNRNLKKGDTLSKFRVALKHPHTEKRKVDIEIQIHLVAMYPS